MDSAVDHGDRELHHGVVAGGRRSHLHHGAVAPRALSPSLALARRTVAVGLLAGLLALLLVNDRGVPQSATTTVNFDTPAPPGGPGPLGGVSQGIDFGTGQWAWTDPYDVDSRRVPRPPLGHDSQLQSQPEVPGPELHAGRDEVD